MNSDSWYFKLEKQMLNQNLRADSDEDDSSCDFCFGFIAGAEDIAHFYPQDRQAEGDNADKGNGRNDMYAEESEGNAHGQGIDAGGYRQHDHIPEGNGIVTVIFLGIQGFLDHIAADDDQKDERDPVVVGCDGVLKIDAQQVTQQRHQSLESAKIQADDNGVTVVHFPHGQALADGYGEGVHGQAHGNEKQFEQRHMESSWGIRWIRA